MTFFCTFNQDGFHGDCSKTFPVGQVDESGQNLIKTTEECLAIGINACGPGKLYHDIGFKIETYANDKGFNIIPVFTGHGIGAYFHGPPGKDKIHN
jgi:methionyl aminopeptidase